MSQMDGSKDMFAELELPMKRKRGRPHKAEGSSSGEAENQHHPPHPTSSAPANQQRNNEILNDSGHACGNSSDSVLGQVVHGVIDADFGDGYLVSFRLGEINMKGVALKTNRVAPITAANDVAPLAKMFLRRGIPFQNIDRQTQVASDAAAATILNSVTNQKVTGTGFDGRPVQIASSLNEEDPALVQNPDGVIREAEEEPKSDCESEPLSNLTPGDEVQAVHSELESSGPRPVNAEAKVLKVELEEAPEPKPLSPVPEITTEAVHVAMGSKSMPDIMTIDEVKSGLQPDQVPFPAEPKKATSPKKPADTLAGPEPYPSAEVTLSLGLNQPFISSEVRERPTSLEPMKSKAILDGGFNLNVESDQTPIPTGPGPMMFLAPVFDLAGSSVADDAAHPLTDHVMNIPSQDTGASVGLGLADADVGSSELAEGFVAPEGNE